MSLFDELLSNNGSALVKQLAQNFNLDESTTQAAIGQMLPAITRGVQRNSASSTGMRHSCPPLVVRVGLLLAVLGS